MFSIALEGVLVSRVSGQVDWVSAAGAGILVPGGQVLRTLLDDDLSAGLHQLSWNTSGGYGGPTATGFYRIYAQIGDELFFADQFVINGYDNHSIDFWLQLFGQQ